MKYLLKSAATALGITAFAAAAYADENVYGPFPVTVKGYQGDAKNSVKYTGQIARHTLHDSLKKLSGKGNGKPNADLKAQLTAYYAGNEDGRAIVAPASKDGFPILQSTVKEISAKRNLSGKTYGGAISGWPNNMTGAEVVQFWIEKAAAADGGYDMRHGYEYPQLISKFIMGAVFYNQVVDHYLDENMAADKKPNDKPYGKGAAYTGKEHSWDEAFGYFGAPAHTLKLTPQQVYDIAKQKPAVFKAADYNGDGKIDLRSEMTFGPAYYAASFDASAYGSKNETRYLHTIVKAFYDGRKLLADANGEKLTDAQRSKLKGYAATIEKAWERVLAEAVFKYAGSVYKDLQSLQTVIDAKGDASKATKKYVHHWGELKGFALALQTGRANLGETAVKLNRLIGYGPVLANQSQVVGVNSDGAYVKGEGPSLGEYMLHMLKVQQLMADEFDVRARVDDRLADIKGLSKKIKAGGSAEND
jgi:hypothetical protein